MGTGNRDKGEPVEPGSSGADRPSPWRRYGPLVAILVVVAVVVAIAVVASRDDEDETATDDTVEADATFEGVLSWSDAVEQGIVDDIDWGERCDTERGRVRYPSFFAPECYAPFDGDNGGATDKGVTADSIKIVYYQTPENDPVIDYITREIQVDDTNDETLETVQGWIELYETYFETYGRNVELVRFVGTGPSEDPVAARADAVTIADMDPFAVLGGPLLTSDFADELAAREILCIQCTPGQDAEFYIERSPYVWSVANNGEQSNSHAAEYITKRLAGQPAEHAGDPALQPLERSFGLVYLSTSESSERVVRGFEEQLADGGVELAAALSYQSPVDLQSTAPQYIAQLKDAGVTTVLFSGDPIAPQSLTQAATSQEYSPEWMVVSAVLADTSTFARTYDQDQWANAFGVSTLAARTDPSVGGARYLFEWFHGEPPPTETGSPTTIPMFNLFYAVIQGVGPNLTHENFRAALFSANPTQRAVTQPSLSYGDKGIWPFDDYLGIDDATEIWWDPDAEGPDEINRSGRGMWRFVDGGRRYLPGSWPETPPALFDPAGTVTIYTDIPPDEQVPDYPSPRAGG
jgi:hypothetical protein